MALTMMCIALRLHHFVTQKCQSPVIDLRTSRHYCLSPLVEVSTTLFLIRSRNSPKDKINCNPIIFLMITVHYCKDRLFQNASLSIVYFRFTDGDCKHYFASSTIRIYDLSSQQEFKNLMAFWSSCTRQTQSNF